MFVRQYFCSRCEMEHNPPRGVTHIDCQCGNKLTVIDGTEDMALSKEEYEARFAPLTFASRGLAWKPFRLDDCLVNMTATEVLAAERAWAKQVTDNARHSDDPLVDEIYRMLNASSAE